MALIIKDRVKETTTTTGTGALTLAGAVVGFRAFSSVCSTNDTCWYALQAVDGGGNPTGDWEVGLGTYSAANTLTRTTIYASSNSNAAVSLSGGTKQVWIGPPATMVPFVDPHGMWLANKPSQASGYTTQSNSTATVTQGDLASGRGFWLKVVRAGTGLDSMAQIGKAPVGAGANNWTLTALLSTTLPFEANYAQYGVYVQDTSGNTLRYGPVGSNIQTYPGLSIDKWVSWPSSPSYSGRQTLTGAPGLAGGPLWLRLAYVNGGNLTFSVSVDGENWSIKDSRLATTWITASHAYAGIILNANFGAVGDEAVVSCFHFDLS